MEMEYEPKTDFTGNRVGGKRISADSDAKRSSKAIAYRKIDAVPPYMRGQIRKSRQTRQAFAVLAGQAHSGIHVVEVVLARGAL